MPMATVTLRSPLRRLAGDRSEVVIPGSTVSEVLTHLEQKHPKLSGWILDERGEIREHVNVFVNGDRATLDAAVADRDRVHIIQAISGGLGGVARPEWHMSDEDERADPPIG
jgi:molybdopterin synthase sulfur carrier subunit